MCAEPPPGGKLLGGYGKTQRASVQGTSGDTRLQKSVGPSSTTIRDLLSDGRFTGRNPRRGIKVRG